MKIKLKYNSPVILTFAIISFAALIANMLTGGVSNYYFFEIYRSRLTDPLLYVRLFGHIFGHADFSHYTGNFMMILLVGPSVEERYGSRNLVLMIAITAFLTGLLHILLFSNTALLGASGIAFMLIVLGSATNFRKGEFPLTLLIVAVLYIGDEILAGMTGADNISQLTHILGGLLGIIFALKLNK